jgi:hypothetical protein
VEPYWGVLVALGSGASLVACRVGGIRRAVTGDRVRLGSEVLLHEFQLGSPVGLRNTLVNAAILCVPVRLLAAAGARSGGPAPIGWPALGWAGPAAGPRWYGFTQ